MSTGRKILIFALIVIVLFGGVFLWLARGDTADIPFSDVVGDDPRLDAANPELIPTVAIADPIGWADNEVPSAAEGLAVTRFADGLDHPRVMHTLPNGDVLATLTRSPPIEGSGLLASVTRFLLEKAGSYGPSANTLLLLRDTDEDGAADVQVPLKTDLNSPSGIAWQDGKLYVANHDALLEFSYELGAKTLIDEGRKLMDLPSGGNHWMRNIAIDPSGERLYIAVGSASNIGENGMEAEEGRAAIWEYNLETGSARPYATGLRNPNGLDWNPWSGELWTTVNERDMLGSDLVPDYLTNVPVGAQYGWPWIYYKDNYDRRVKEPMPAYLQEYVRWPEYSLGPHVAALGLAFSGEGNRLGAGFSSGAFIARHGSWNRKPPSGYDVIFVEFDDRGNPQGKPKPVLSGFLQDGGKTKGRPTWVEFASDGALLVSDDTAGIIWRVIAPGAEPAPAIERKTRRSLPPQRQLSGEARASFGEDDYARVQPAE